MVHKVGVHDKNYVDAYFGLPSLKEEALKKKMSLSEIVERADVLRFKIKDARKAATSAKDKKRCHHLDIMIKAMIARIKIISRAHLSFDDESRLIYNITVPVKPLEEYKPLMKELDKYLPGKGDLKKRYLFLTSPTMGTNATGINFFLIIFPLTFLKIVRCW